jgi:hypothetical protein
MAVRLATLIAGVALIVAGTACTRAPQVVEQGDASSAAGAENEFDFSNPIPDGEEVPLSALDDPKSLSVPFAPLVLARHTPNLVQETPREQAPADHRQMAFAYDSPDEGQFVIFEFVLDSGAAMAEWERDVAQPEGCETNLPDPGISDQTGVTCHFGKREFVNLSDGTRAYLFTGENGISLSWAVSIPEPLSSALKTDQMDEPAIIVEVEGLRVSMSRDELVGIADEVKGQ